MGDVNYLYEPEGTELHWEGLQEAKKPSVQQASLSGPAPSYSSPASRQGLGGSTPTEASFRPQAVPKQPHQMSPDELLKYAQNMLATQEAQNSHAMAQGPATGQRTDTGTQTPKWLSEYMDKQDKDL